MPFMRAANVTALPISAWMSACGGPRVCTPNGAFDWQGDCDVVDCHAAAACDVACGIDMTCGQLDCSRAGQCRFDCQDRATCGPTDCTDTGDCFVHCWDGSTCDVACDRSQRCSVACTAGGCLLRCGAAADCRFDEWSGGAGVIDCGGGVLACNRGCP